MCTGVPFYLSHVQKEMELKDLQKRRGSDQGSDVLCTDPGESANGCLDSPISNIPEINTAAIMRLCLLYCLKWSL